MRLTYGRRSKKDELTCAQGQVSAGKRTATALLFIKVAQSLLQEVQQSLSREDTAMDLDEDDEQPMGPLSSQAGAILVVSEESVAC